MSNGHDEQIDQEHRAESSPPPDSPQAPDPGTDAPAAADQTFVYTDAADNSAENSEILDRFAGTVVPGNGDLFSALPGSSLKPPENTGASGSTTDSVSRSGSLRPRNIQASEELVEELSESSSDDQELDYVVLDELGEGGMGTVHLARQVALGRNVALKQIHRKSGRDQSVRDEFLMEAVLTGKLEHPNIVPVYEVGESPGGELFYSMKNIQGQPWDDLIGTHTLDENLSILVDVCDAVAFAHAEGVIHRDLKPQNIMIGGFGEVLVLDWGMAVLATADEDVMTSAGGTPSYMAPEMVNPPYCVGPRSDVYLLGGILFRLLTGRTPHDGESAIECLKSASRNEIVDPDADRQRELDPSGELLGVALRAMKTLPEDRYQTVQEFQQSVRDFESHRESLQVCATAEEALVAAGETGEYSGFSRAVFGFEQALALWDGNQRARDTMTEARLAYAACAEAREDYDLALSLLNELGGDNREMRDRLVAAKDKRDARQRQVRQLRRLLMSAGVAILVLVSAAAVWINRERQISVRNEQIALENLRTSERNAYNSDMLLAQQHWEDADVHYLEDLLDRYKDHDDLTQFEWGYWRRMISSDLLTIRGHASRVRRVEFSPDGKQIVSASVDNVLKTSDASTGETLVTFAGHDGPDGCWCAGFSPDGKRIVSGGVDRLVKVWNAATGQETLTLKGHTGFITAVCFSPDGKRILSGSSDTSLKIWNASTGETELTFGGHGSPVTSAEFSEDGQSIVSGGARTVIIWDAETGQSQSVFEEHTGYVTAVAFSPDGKQVVSGSVDQTVRVWDISSGRASLTLEGHPGGLWAVDFGPDGKQVASGDDQNIVKLWDIATGQETLTIRGHSGPVTSLDFSPDGKRIVSCSADTLVKVWDATTGQDAVSLGNHTGPVTSSIFSPDGQHLVSGGEDGTLKVLDAAAGSTRFTIKGHSRAVTGLSFSPDGSQFVSSSEDRTLRLWNISTGKALKTLDGHSSPITCVNFSPNGKQLLSTSSRTIKIWDLSSGQATHTFKGHSSRIRSAAFNPDGNRIVSGSMDNTLKLWDATTGKELRTFTGHTDAVWSVCFSPDGRRIASGSFDQTLKVWDAETGDLIFTLKGHSGFVRSVGFSPNGQRIVSGSDDGTVKLWDTPTGQTSLTLNGHTGPVLSVGFGPEGWRIVSGGEDRSLKVWDASSD